VEQFPQIIAPWPASADGGDSPYADVREIAKESIKIKPGKVHQVQIEVVEDCLVGWKLQVLGSSKHLEFQIVKKASDAECSVILPKRKVECGTNPYCQVTHLSPGSYVMELDNKASTISSKDVEFCVVKSKPIPA